TALTKCFARAISPCITVERTLRFLTSISLQASKLSGCDLPFFGAPFINPRMDTAPIVAVPPPAAPEFSASNQAAPSHIADESDNHSAARSVAAHCREWPPAVSRRRPIRALSASRLVCRDAAGGAAVRGQERV